MGRAEGLLPRNRPIFPLLDVLCTHVGQASAGAIIDALPELDEPRINVLTRVATGTQTWLVEAQRADRIRRDKKKGNG